VRRPLLALAALGALLLTGCGSSGGSSSASASRRPPQAANLVLDFTPNADHTGIYEAIARHDDLRSGVRLHVIIPSASTDSIRLLETGRVDFAVLDIHDLAIARERGQGVVGIMALEQRPLASVIAAPGLSNPRQLAGHTVGVSGDPSDLAVLHSVVAGAGARPASVRAITIGFNAVPDLLAGRVAAATAFWDDEGVTLRQQRPGFHIFRVDDYGAPSYPELVLCATEASLRSDPTRARAVVRALTLGYEQVIQNPAAGLRALTSQVPGLSARLQGAELHALLPAFSHPGGRVGALDPSRLRAWASWERRFGIVSRRPDVGAMFTEAFLPAS
jgi:ABC-type nitrate/sulfonate/bicarbonate transport system substrate-binding protein